MNSPASVVKTAKSNRIRLNLTNGKRMEVYESAIEKDRVVGWTSESRIFSEDVSLPLADVVSVEVPSVAVGRILGPVVLVGATGDRGRVKSPKARDDVKDVVLSFQPAPGERPGVTVVQSQIDFSDFRTVGDLRWPHHLVTQENGKVTDDTTIETAYCSSRCRTPMARDWSMSGVTRRSLGMTNSRCSLTCSSSTKRKPKFSNRWRCSRRAART